MSEISQHFDELAPVYDSFKRKNWYYYQNLKKLAARFIPPGKTVLEIGTATGDILASLLPSKGVGTDISPEMIAIAREKYKGSPNLSFFSLPADKLEKGSGFEHIILVDVVEHVDDLDALAGQIRTAASPGTRVFISMANPLWEPILMLLEKLKMKMPEGQHNRVSAGDLAAIFRNNGFELRQHGFSLVFPAYLPLVSVFLNWIFPKTPLLKKLCMIEYLVFQPFERAS
ncbi:MAG TPA: class I SAM-dependent methyltransferase [Elusimicrobiales bacterium]|nr:class I SAM-dependent methyltransferase [Elusimicrobiales bacterium]